jgi:hypothetical protein
MYHVDQLRRSARSRYAEFGSLAREGKRLVVEIIDSPATAILIAARWFAGGDTDRVGFIRQT